MSTLMTLERDAMALESLLLESGGELNETLEAWIAEIETNLAVKADAYSVVIDRLDHSEEYLLAQAEKYRNAAKTLGNTKDRIKNRIKDSMRVMGRAEIQGDNVVFKLAKSAPKLVFEAQHLPKKYVEIVQPPAYESIDKESLLKDLKEGQTIEGARLEEVFSLRKTIKKGN